MKILVLIGNNPNQVALVHKLNDIVGVSNVVIEKRVPKKQALFSKFKGLFQKLLTYELHATWRDLMKNYSSFKLPTNSHIFECANINHPETVQYIAQANPDLIVVSGTRLVKQDILNLKPRLGIVNLHTGLSPYVKGGPNCTNWCLANKAPERIGNTIMWIDAGIDTGNIITTAFTPLHQVSSMLNLHTQVMDHAHQLYIDAIQQICAAQKVPNVPQKDIDLGQTYYTKDWTFRQQLKAIFNFYMLKNKRGFEDLSAKQAGLVTVSLVK